MKPQFKDYLLLHISFFIYAFAAVLAKLASGHPFLSFWFLLFAGGEVAVLGLYALLWQVVLGRFPLTKAYAAKGTVVLWGLVFGFILFQEKITMMNLLGSVVILTGVVVVSSDGK